MYTIKMKFNKLLAKIKALQNIDESSVNSLYALSMRSFAVNMLLAMFVTIALYPILHFKILVWFIILVSLLLYRFYNTYLFNQNPDKFTIKRWHKRFIIQAIISAVIYASLGFMHIHYLDYYYQLFIVTVLLGLSSGSSFALSPDARLSMTYMAILLFPLMITLVFIDNMPLNSILSMMLFMYFIAQVTTIITIYTQKQTIETLESKHTFLNSLFKNAPLGIFTYNKKLEVLDCNEQLSQLFDHSVETIVGMQLYDLPDTRGISTFSNIFTDGTQSYEGPYISLNGKHFWIEAKAFPFSDTENIIHGGVGIIEDKTKEHNALEELEYLVKHDVLTGLLNRRGFSNYIEELVLKREHEIQYSILFYLDLDQFKSINDSLGHGIGDEVLLAVSHRLVKSLGRTCKVSRLGGDEFIIVVPHISKDIDTAKKESKNYSKSIQEVFQDPYRIKEMALHITASIGIVIIKPGYSNTEEIIRHADLAMYQAKNDNSHISYYDESLDKKQKNLFLLQHDLAYATEHNQLELFFQPIVNMEDERLCSAELLLRWTHPSRGLLSPEEFIPIAIKAGFLSEITWWLVDRVCQQISQWKKDGTWKLDYVSININAKQFLEKDFAKVFLKNLKLYNVETSDIMLEITERSLIDHFSATQGVINDLRSYGIKCAIDDFGIGYSSLSYLKKLSFHTLKIDREFVKDIGQNPKEVALIATILEIGRQFDYNIVIEGIENEQQKKILLELDNELSYQGYYFSKPLHTDEFSKKFLS